MFGTVRLFEPSCTQEKGYHNIAPGVLSLQILQNSAPRDAVLQRKVGNGAILKNGYCLS